MSSKTLASLREQFIRKQRSLTELLQRTASPTKADREKLLLQFKKKNAGGNSKRYKIAKDLFKVFIQSNHLPTGRKKGKKYRMLSLFKALKMRHASSKYHMAHKQYTVQYHFNNFLVSFIKNNHISKSVQKVGGTTIVRWFRQLFKDTALSPHPTDYCATCHFHWKKIVSVKQQITMLRQHNNSTQKTLAELQTSLQEAQNQFQYHKKQVHRTKVNMNNSDVFRNLFQESTMKRENCCARSNMSAWKKLEGEWYFIQTLWYGNCIKSCSAW